MEPEQLTEAGVSEGGCSYYGGLGHRFTVWPKMEVMQNKMAGEVGKKDYLAADFEQVSVFYFVFIV